VTTLPVTLLLPLPPDFQSSRIFFFFSLKSVPQINNIFIVNLALAISLFLSDSLTSVADPKPHQLESEPQPDVVPAPTQNLMYNLCRFS
jgi:hypothetical protein